MMDIRNEWYDAVFARRSRRQFDGRPLDPAHLRRIEEVCEGFRPWPAVRSVLVAERPDAILTGAIGSYGKVKGAAAYVAFIGDMDSPTVQESVGYMGEGVILEATTLGVGTCWIGGYFKPEAVAAQVGTGTGERVLAVTPLGYTPEAWTLEERLMVALAGSARRKPVGDIYRGPAPSEWLSLALEAARLAPSAVNRQPWRFVSEGEDVLVEEVVSAWPSGHISRRLDCGIAMLHFELGARRGGRTGTWTLLPEPRVARFEP